MKGINMLTKEEFIRISDIIRPTINNVSAKYDHKKYPSSDYNRFKASFASLRKDNTDISEEFSTDTTTDSIKWILRENPAWTNNGINRNNSTVQKSWAIIEPHRFADEFSIAIIGHRGWDKNLENESEYSLCVSFEVLDAQLNIYEILSQAQIEIENEQEIEI